MRAPFQILAIPYKIIDGLPLYCVFHRALAKAQCLPVNAVMIGDRLDNDMVPAQKVGMKTVWIKQGLGGLASAIHKNEQADYEIENLSELLAIF